MSNSNQTSPVKEVGTKYDQDKPKFSLIPQRALELVAKVLTFGAKKYGPRNWTKTKDLSARYTDAALRHINAYLRGEQNDEETGLPHLSHAVASLLFVLEYEAVGQTIEQNEEIVPLEEDAVRQLLARVTFSDGRQHGVYDRTDIHTLKGITLWVVEWFTKPTQWEAERIRECLDPVCGRELIFYKEAATETTAQVPATIARVMFDNGVWKDISSVTEILRLEDAKLLVIEWLVAPTEWQKYRLQTCLDPIKGKQRHYYK